MARNSINKVPVAGNTFFHQKEQKLKYLFHLEQSLSKKKKVSKWILARHRFSFWVLPDTCKCFPGLGTQEE